MHLPDGTGTTGQHERFAMANKWFETVAEAQRRAKKRLPKSVYGALVAGSERGLTLEDNITAYSRAGLRPPRGRPGPEPGPDDQGDGPGDLVPRPHLPHRRPGRPPRRRGRHGRRRRRPRHRHGSELLRQHAGRGRRGGQPADLLPDLLDRHAGPDRGAGRAGPGRRGRRPHRDPGLVLLPRARLGQPHHPRDGRPAGDGCASPPRPWPTRAGCCRSPARASSPT